MVGYLRRRAGRVRARHLGVWWRGVAYPYRRSYSDSLDLILGDEHLAAVRSLHPDGSARRSVADDVQSHADFDTHGRVVGNRLVLEHDHAAFDHLGA